jgi:hypothetical protein
MSGILNQNGNKDFTYKLPSTPGKKNGCSYGGEIFFGASKATGNGTNTYRS